MIFIPQALFLGEVCCNVTLFTNLMPTHSDFIKACFIFISKHLFKEFEHTGLHSTEAIKQNLINSSYNQLLTNTYVYNYTLNFQENELKNDLLELILLISRELSVFSVPSTSYILKC